MSFGTLRNVCQDLNDGPQTPNEIADKRKLSQKYSSLVDQQIQ